MLSPSVYEEVSIVTRPHINRTAGIPWLRCYRHRNYLAKTTRSTHLSWLLH
jgi:hypothetical protein